MANWRDLSHFLTDLWWSMDFLSMICVTRLEVTTPVSKGRDGGSVKQPRQMQEQDHSRSNAFIETFSINLFISKNIFKLQQVISHWESTWVIGQNKILGPTPCEMKGHYRTLSHFLLHVINVVIFLARSIPKQIKYYYADEEHYTNHWMWLLYAQWNIYCDYNKTVSRTVWYVYCMYLTDNENDSWFYV